MPREHKQPSNKATYGQAGWPEWDAEIDNTYSDVSLIVSALGVLLPIAVAVAIVLSIVF